MFEGNVSEDVQNTLLPTLGQDQLPDARRDAVDSEALSVAEGLIDEVRAGGEGGLRTVAERFGDLQPDEDLVIGSERLAAAFDRLPVDQQALLRRTAARIEAFAVAQRATLVDLDVPVPGGRAGHTWTPVQRAGCYAPGGRFPLPSSVLMTVIPARVAGVQEVFVASPRPAEITLAAAHVAGANAVLAVGGAQAIAALALGVGVPAVDVIVGPGNRYVTAAKQLVTGRVGIDMLAGPSELVVVADAAADPVRVAADLIGQAEHDPDAVTGLITTDPTLPERVRRALESQLVDLPTAGIARQSLAAGFAVVCGDLHEAVALSDRLAPEHLELLVADAEALKPTHYGALFVGTGAAEVFGDYGAGPNHVLPTGSSARFSGGLSVADFLRLRTWLRMDEGSDASDLIDDVAALARLEGLEGHARSAELRRR
jgi:histidinol dehydrogenase